MSHNALGMVNRFTRAVLRVELAADEGDVPTLNMYFSSPINPPNLLVNRPMPYDTINQLDNPSFTQQTTTAYPKISERTKISIQD